TVWYSFTPTQDLFVEANAASSDYQTVLEVFTGSRGALELVTCSGSAVQFGASAGTKYFILVGASFFNEAGHLILTVRGRPKLKISVTVDPDAAADSKIGAATIQGIVTSSQPVTISLNGLLRQRVGRLHIIAGEFGAPQFYEGDHPVLIRCSGRTPWS